MREDKEWIKTERRTKAGRSARRTCSSVAEGTLSFGMGRILRPITGSPKKHGFSDLGVGVFDYVLTSAVAGQLGAGLDIIIRHSELSVQEMLYRFGRAWLP